MDRTTVASWLFSQYQLYCANIDQSIMKMFYLLILSCSIGGSFMNYADMMTNEMDTAYKKSLHQKDANKYQRDYESIFNEEFETMDSSREIAYSGTPL